MPIVMSYDDPALVATLAAQAGSYAQNDRDFARAMALGRNTTTAVHLDGFNDNPDTWGQPRRNSQQAQEQSNAQGIVQTTDTTPGGATIYGTAPIGIAGGQFEYAQGSHGSTSHGQYEGGNGYMFPQQRKMHAYVDQLAQGNHIGPDEAIRMHALIDSGQNPFEKQTVNEIIRSRAAQNDGLTPYQQAQIDMAKNRLGDSEANQKFRIQSAPLIQQRRQLVIDAADLTKSADERNAAKTRLSEIDSRLADLMSQTLGAIDAPGMQPAGSGSTQATPSTQPSTPPSTRPAGKPKGPRIVRNADGTISSFDAGGREVSRLTPGDTRGQLPFDLAAKAKLVSRPDRSVVLKRPEGDRVFTAEQVLELVRKYGSAAAAQKAVLAGLEG